MPRLRLLVLTCASLLCFAANSLLCRMALRGGEIDAQAFTMARILSGALFLLVFVAARKGTTAILAGSWRGALALLVYAYFFSYSYLRLDAGIGALILFATVLAVMIGWSITRSSRPSRSEWGGMVLALCGLAVLSLPGTSAPQLMGVLQTGLAGVAWGVYSLLAKRGSSPEAATAGNFIRGAPIALALFFLTGSPDRVMSERGILLATISGAITSGLGYSLWYAAVPALGPVRAAVAQLSVPVLTMIAAAFAMSETYPARSLAAAVVTIAGVGLALLGSGSKR